MFLNLDSPAKTNAIRVPFGSTSDSFDDDGGRHTARGAHGDEAVATARAFEFVERGADQDRACGADRVAERHRAAVDVHLLAIEIEVADELLGDDREGLVDRKSTRLNSSH